MSLQNFRHNLVLRVCFCAAMISACAVFQCSFGRISRCQSLLPSVNGHTVELSFHDGSSLCSFSFLGFLRYSLKTRQLFPSSWCTSGCSLSHLGRPPSFCLAYIAVYLHIWPAYYPSRVSDHRQGVGVDCSDLVFPIQLTLQDLPHPLQVFGGCGFPSDLLYI